MTRKKGKGSRTDRDTLGIQLFTQACSQKQENQHNAMLCYAMPAPCVNNQYK